MNEKTHITAAFLADALGPDNIALAVGRTTKTVLEAARDGEFPARYYIAMKRMCEARGIDCPPAAFSFLGLE